MRETLAFVALPYLALALFVAVPIVRAGQKLRRPPAEAPRAHPYRGSAAWHYGLVALGLGHLAAFLLPGPLEVWNRVPLRLLILEATGWGAGLLALFGLLGLLRGRATAAAGDRPSPGLFASAVDTLFLTVVALELVSGLVMAFVYRWGSSWYAVTLLPYLRSLATFRPDVGWIAGLPPLVKLHVLGGIVAVAVLPWTALGEALAMPWASLGRRRLGLGLGYRRESPGAGGDGDRVEVALS